MALGQILKRYEVERFQSKLGYSGVMEWRLAVAGYDSLAKAQDALHWQKVNEPGRYRVIEVTEVRVIVDA